MSEGMLRRAQTSRIAVSRLLALAPLLAALTLPPGCSKDGAPEPEPALTGPSLPPEPAPSCPSEPLPETRAPDVEAVHERAGYWLAKYEAKSNHVPLLDAAERAALRERVASLPGGWRDPLGEEGADEALVAQELQDRLEWLRERVESGTYVEGEAGSFGAAAARVESSEALAQPALRFVASETPLWCIPSRAGLFTQPIDRDFDRNRCASLHPGELLRTLRSAEQGAWLYVDAGHSVGWVDQRAGATLEPAVDPDEARARARGEPRAYLTGDHEGLRAGTSFPWAPAGRAPEPGAARVLVPGVEGPQELSLGEDAPLSEGPLPFTRARVFEQAFALLEQPYGWGGRAGQRDCSRYTYDLFAQFGLGLARNSGVQAKLGTRSVDLSALDEQPKRAAIREAAAAGVVLLYMPGHIMLYLGHEGGQDYGLSALSEYLTPCAGGEDTVHRLDKVAVTTLELGRGTERRAFIERITRMAVFD